LAKKVRLWRTKWLLRPRSASKSKGASTLSLESVWQEGLALVRPQHWPLWVCIWSKLVIECYKFLKLPPF
jgi:hypothetical protein